MAAPATATLSNVVTGDTWDGINPITITVDAVPPTNPVTQAKMSFKRSKKNRNADLTLSTVDGTIFILDDDNWSLRVPPTKLGLEPGTYKWDLETVDSAGNIQTYVEGNLTVLRDVTRRRKAGALNTIYALTVDGDALFFEGITVTFDPLNVPGYQACVDALEGDGATLTAADKVAIKNWFKAKNTATWGPKVVSMVWTGGGSLAVAQRDWIDPTWSHAGDEGGTPPAWNAGFVTPAGTTYIDPSSDVPMRSVWNTAGTNGGFFWTGSDVPANAGNHGLSWQPRSGGNADGRIYAYMHNTVIGQGGLRTDVGVRDGVWLQTLHLSTTGLGRALYRGVSGGGSREEGNGNQVVYLGPSAHDNHRYMARTNDGGGSTLDYLTSGNYSFFGMYDPSLGDGQPADAAAADVEGIDFVENLRTLAVALGHTALP